MKDPISKTDQISKTFTGEDVKRLLQKASDYYTSSQSYEIQLQRYIFGETEEVYPSIYWSYASIDVNDMDWSSDWWLMRKDGTWFRPWHEEEEE